MLRKSQRLNSRQFDEIMKRGRIIHSPLFMARILSSTGPTGVATVAPVKVAKTSAQRHLVRRRMYEAVRYNLYVITPGTTIVIIAKAAALDKKPAEMAAELQSLFVKAGIIR